MQETDEGNGTPGRRGHSVGHAALDALLAELALDGSTRRAPSVVRQRLQAEAQLRADRMRSRQLASARLRQWLLPLAALAAVIAGLVVAGGLLFAPERLAATARSAMLTVSHWVDLRPASGGVPADSQPQVSKPDLASAASSSDTFPIAYSDPAIANGTAATVRVSLPDSELLAWGVPSPSRDPDELVPVDLTLGDDGLPQAVRILPTATSTSEEIYP